MKTAWASVLGLGYGIFEMKFSKSFRNEIFEKFWKKCWGDEIFESFLRLVSVLFTTYFGLYAIKASRKYIDFIKTPYFN